MLDPSTKLSDAVEWPRPATRAMEVRVAHARRYAVHVEPGCLARYGSLLATFAPNARIVVLSDERVRRLYGAALLRSLRAAGYDPNEVTIPEGERSKSWKTAEAVLGRLFELGLDRRGVLVNFGGGVVSDLGGFVASVYMRGIRYANFATSLIGQLDASIGGKVGINTKEAKNLLGAFHHPCHVASDPELLGSLSRRDFASGIAEGIKVAILADPALFESLERDRDRILEREPGIVGELVRHAARAKIALLANDPYESDLRRPLNLGHTLGHPIETEFGYRKIRHGEAVAIGIGVATSIALHRRLIPRHDANRIHRLLASYGLLGFSDPIRPDRVIEHVRAVRLIRGRSLHFVLPTHIGGVTITDELTDQDIVQGFEDYERVVRGSAGS